MTNLALDLSLSGWHHAFGGQPPQLTPPIGYAFLTLSDGTYLTDNNGNFLIVKV